MAYCCIFMCHRFVAGLELWITLAIARGDIGDFLGAIATMLFSGTAYVTVHPLFIVLA